MLGGMRAIVQRAAGVVVCALGAFLVVFVVGIRVKSPRVLRFGRWFTRAIVNPYQMRSAGGRGAYASVIRHRGRRTGRDYATPVQAVPTAGSFVIPLPYGVGTNWVRNVLASGSATIVNDGQSYRVGHPETIPIAETDGLFSARDTREHRLFGLDTCLRVEVLAPPEASPSPR
jgi:hypothetical protein